EEELKPGLFDRKYIAEVREIDQKRAHGKLLVLLSSEGKQPEIGETCFLISQLQPIPRPLNPQQFNYHNFMKNKGILYQAAPLEKAFWSLGNSEASLAQKAERTRSAMILKLRMQPFGERELGIIQALLL